MSMGTHGRIAFTLSCHVHIRPAEFDARAKRDRFKKYLVTTVASFMLIKNCSICFQRAPDGNHIACILHTEPS